MPSRPVLKRLMLFGFLLYVLDVIFVLHRLALRIRAGLLMGMRIARLLFLLLPSFGGGVFILLIPSLFITFDHAFCLSLH